jgi:hypothetical protein
MAFGTKNAAFCLPGIHIGLACSTPAVTVGRAITHRKKVLYFLTSIGNHCVKQKVFVGRAGV